MHQNGANTGLEKAEKVLYQSKYADWLKENTTYFALDGKKATDITGLLIEQYPVNGEFRRKKVLVIE